jgi:hypothetical protein
MTATRNLLSKLSLTESDEFEEIAALEDDIFESRNEWLTRVREELDENLINMNMTKENAKKKKRDGKGAYTSDLKGKERKGGGVCKGKEKGQNYKRGPVVRESLEWLESVREALEADLAED